MKTINSKLFEKSFDLKKSNVYGGKQTFRECSTATTSGSCTDVKTTSYDDTGKTLTSCTDYDCK